MYSLILEPFIHFPLPRIKTMANDAQTQKRQDAREVIGILAEISLLLVCRPQPISPVFPPHAYAPLTSPSLLLVDVSTFALPKQEVKATFD